jgi:uridine kinase
MQANTRVTLIGIAGPSCAGKSTVIELLRERIPFSLVPLDHFFRKIPAGTMHGFANWEVAESLMLDRLASCLAELRRGEPVLIPRAPWTEDFSLRVDPAPLVLVEGFLLFVHADICDLLDCRVFIDIPEEEQLQRRCMRDTDLDPGYIETVVIPSFRRYRPLLLRNSDMVIDGTRSVEEVADGVKAVIEECEVSGAPVDQCGNRIRVE